MYKVLKYTFWFGLTLVILLFVTSFVSAWWMGKDIETMKSYNKSFEFSAQRDGEGVWEIDAADKASLWYAIGQVHSHDRYFHLEITRHAALGRLGEIFGEEVLSRDRFTRSLAVVAKDAYSKIKDPALLRSTEIFAKSVNDWRSSENNSLPVEFRLLGLDIKDLPEWEPWHVLAISYVQAWGFSYDMKNELRKEHMISAKGKTWVDHFVPDQTYSQRKDVYSQSTVKPAVRRESLNSLEANAKISAFAFSPDKFKTLDKDFSLDAKEVTTDFQSKPIEEAVQPGASNAWIMYSKLRNHGPILCNDPHLSLMWPSTLYPVKFKVGNVQSAGWSLVGQPFLAIGMVNKEDKSLAWGVTLATYSRVQLIESNYSTMGSYKQRFKLRNPDTHETKVVETSEEWTNKGPLASKWFGKNRSEKDWALRYLSYEGFTPPVGYFLKLNFEPSADVSELVSSKWSMPAVNFNWIKTSEGEKKWGHIITGTIYKSNGGYSYSKDRPFVESSSKKSKDFWLVTGNQQIWNSSLSKDLADTWSSPLRTTQIYKHKEDNLNNPGYSQVDSTSQLFRNFLTYARNTHAVTRLCAEGSQDMISKCQDDLSELDAWKGKASADDWRPSLMRLWVGLLKWRLWNLENRGVERLKIVKSSEPDLKSFINWERSNASQEMLWALSSNPKWQSSLKQKFKVDLDEYVLSSFKEAYALLNEKLGADRNLWSWGNLHRVAWQHPMMKVFGPNLPFLGPPMSGANDAPMRASSEWDPRYPLVFPVVHGAVQRSCYDLSGNRPALMWSAITGPSGNPFSDWSKTFSNEYYFKSKLYRDDFFSKKQ